MGLVESKPNESAQTTGLCRRRNSKSPKSSPQPAQGKVVGSEGKLMIASAPPKLLEKPSQKLPTSAWRELLEEKPSNLQPNGMKLHTGLRGVFADTKGPQSAAIKLPPGLPDPLLDATAPQKQATIAEPEWMQYLSKVAAGRQPPRPNNIPNMSLSNNRTMRGDRAVVANASCEREGGSLFQTGEYLKILKEAPKKAAGAKPKKEARSLEQPGEHSSCCQH